MVQQQPLTKNTGSTPDPATLQPMSPLSSVCTPAQPTPHSHQPHTRALVLSLCVTSDCDQHLAAAFRDLLLRAVPTRAVEDVVENVVAAGLDLAVVA